MDLSVRMFPDFVLRNPVWVASSHFTQSEDSVRAWGTYAPGALTVKTTSLARGGSGKGARTHFEAVGPGESWYSDGPPDVELLSGERTCQVLGEAVDRLPGCLVGASVLQGEDYREFHQYAQRAHFVELNLKYSARPPAGQGPPSFVAFHEEQHRAILADIERFSNEFEDRPHFVKLTREIPWLQPCEEWAQLAALLERLGSAGRRVGLIVANTRQLRVPPSAVTSGRPADTELSGGVLSGEALFHETYHLIRTLKLETPSLDQIPVIASGGVMGLGEMVDVLYAGASTAQLCTAFQFHEMQYCPWLLGQLDRLLAKAQCRSFSTFVRRLRREGETELRRIRLAVRELDVEFGEFVQHEMDRSRNEVLRIVRDTVVAEAEDTRTGDLGPPSECPVPVADDVGVRCMVPERERPLALQTEPEAVPLRVHSLVASPFAHSLFLGVREEYPGKMEIYPHDHSRSVVEALRRPAGWELGVLSEANLDSAAQPFDDEGILPVFLGVIAISTYRLVAIDPAARVREIYHFGGAQSTRCLCALADADPALTEAQTRKATMAGLAQILQHGPPGLGIFAKDPIADICVTVLSQWQSAAQTLGSGAARYLMLASQELVGRLGGPGLEDLYRRIEQAAARIRDNPEWAVELLQRDNYLEKLTAYLSPPRKTRP